ncbi:MAG: 30S ribosomal protein S20 [Halanaerobiaceae bacterium]
MPIIESAKKRVRVTEKKTKVNKWWKERLKNAIKDFEEVIEEGDIEKAEAQYQETQKIVDKAASKGIIHENNAAHKKSRFAKMINELKESE